MRGFIRGLVLLCCLAIIYAGCNHSGGGSSSEDPDRPDIDNNVEPDNTIQLKTWSDDIAFYHAAGRLFAAWIDYRNGDRDVYFNIRQNGTWQLGNDLRINGVSNRDAFMLGGTYASSVSVASSRDGRWVYVVWSDARPGHQAVYLNRSDDYGRSFKGEIPLNKSWPFSNLAEDAYVRCSANGQHVYVVWSDGYQIYLNHSTNYGQDWLAGGEMQISGPLFTLNAKRPRLAVTPDGQYCHVVWSEYGYMYYNNIRQDNISVNSFLSDNTHQPYITPEVCTWNNGQDVGIVWRSMTDTTTYASDLLLALSNNYGLNFPQPYTRVRSNVRTWNPHMDCDPISNNLCVVWEEYDPGSNLWHVWARARIGNALQNAQRLSTQGSPDFKELLPQVAYYDNRAFSVWADYRDNHENIFYRAANGLVGGDLDWGASDAQLNPPSPRSAIFSYKQRIATDGNNVYAGWVEKRSGDNATRIYGMDPRQAGAPNELVSHAHSDYSHGAYPVVCANGNAFFVAWLDDRNGGSDLYFNYTLDGGFHWHSEVQVNSTSGSNCSYPDIACDSDNNVYLVWEELVRDNFLWRSKIYFKKFTFTRGSMVPSTRDPWSPEEGNRPKVAAGNFGNVYVVWEIQDRYASRSGEIRFRESSSYGEQWFGDVQVLENDRDDSRNVQLGTTNSGQYVYIVWQDGPTLNGPSIQFVCSSNYGNAGSWNGIQEIDGTTSRCVDPQIACAGNNVYVIWRDYRHGDKANIYYNYSQNNGGAWQGAQLVGGDGGGNQRSSGNAKIAANTEVVGVVWENYANGEFQIYANVGQARRLSWDGQKQVSAGDVPAFDPAVCAHDDQIYVTWWQVPKIQTRTWKNGTWGTIEEVTTDSDTLAIEPRIRVTDTWRFFAWADYRHHRKRIFVENREN